MDAFGSFSYPETDRSENVRFYQKIDVAVSVEASVLGVPAGFISRPARKREESNRDSLKP